MFHLWFCLILLDVKINLYQYQYQYFLYPTRIPPIPFVYYSYTNYISPVHNHGWADNLIDVNSDY